MQAFNGNQLVVSALKIAHITCAKRMCPCDGRVSKRNIELMSDHSTSMPHKMECVRVYQNELGDLEFEFVCPECGYSEIISLFDSFARGDFFVSHMHDVDGSSYLSINFQTEEAEIPKCFKDFFENLDNED